MPKKCYVDTNQWLDSLGFYRKHVARDETCLFRIVSEQLFQIQLYHETIRKKCVAFVRSNPQIAKQIIREPLDEYLFRLSNHLVECGFEELLLVSHIFNCDVVVFEGSQKTILYLTEKNCTKKIMLCQIQGHFDSVHTKEHMEAIGMCQSLVYSILYGEVFKLENISSGVSLMLYEKAYDINDQGNAGYPANKNMTSNAIGDRPPFPFKVAKSLDPNMYRNVEFDIWVDARRLAKMNNWYYGGPELTIGTRCIVADEVSGDEYHCYIQRMESKHNPCSVFVEELGKIVTVRYSQLKPIPGSQPWALPHRFNRLCAGKAKKSAELKNKNDGTDLKDDRGEKTTETVLQTSGGTEDQSYDKESFRGLNLSLRSPVQMPSLMQEPFAFPSMTLVNFNQPKSVQHNGCDLPYHDIPTLQFFFNYGLECYHSGWCIENSSPEFKVSPKTRRENNSPMAGRGSQKCNKLKSNAESAQRIMHNDAYWNSGHPLSSPVMYQSNVASPEIQLTPASPIKPEIQAVCASPVIFSPPISSWMSNVPLFMFSPSSPNFQS